jgi:ribosome-binding factor A
MLNRIDKVNELIKRHISEIIIKNLDWKPGIFITVSKVDTSPDLRYTRVFVSIFPESETNYVMATFRKEMYAIQGALNKKLATKPLPRIEFKVDDTEIKADKIEKLLKEI